MKHELHNLSEVNMIDTLNSSTLRYVTVSSKNIEAIEFIWIKFDDYMIKIMNNSSGCIKKFYFHNNSFLFLYGKEDRIESYCRYQRTCPLATIRFLPNIIWKNILLIFWWLFCPIFGTILNGFFIILINLKWYFKDKPINT